MQSFVKILVATTFTALASVGPVFLQNSPLPPAPEPPAEAAQSSQDAADADGPEQAPLERAKARLTQELERVGRSLETIGAPEGPKLHEQLARAQAKLSKQLAEAGREIELAQAVAFSPDAEPQPPPGPVAVAGVRQRLNSIVGHAPARALAIRFDQADPAAQATLEEDLSVMSRVLEKSVAQKLGEDEGPKASGIQVFFPSDGGATRNLYLEGYGALFLMNVRFPLLAPAGKVDDEKAKEKTDSSWEDAKRDLYGEHDPWNIGKAFRFDARGGEPQEYDAEKVERLRGSLLEALKSGSNIRGLKPEEWMAIVVVGAPTSGARLAVVKPGTKTDPNVTRRARDERTGKDIVVTDEPSGRSRNGSVMTLRVKKSDVDDFAKGQLDLDQFTRKASITTYPANTGGWGGDFRLF